MAKSSKEMTAVSKDGSPSLSVEEEKFECNNWIEARRRFKSKEKDTEELRFFLKRETTGSSVKQTCEELRESSANEYRQGFGSILGNIDALMNVGDLAIKSAPESVGLAWMGIRMCLHAIQGDWASFQLFGGACSDIVGIMISCRVYGKMWTGKTVLQDFRELHQQVIDYIPTIYTKILDFSYAVHRYAGKHKVIRFTQNIFKDVKNGFEGMINDIKLHDTKMRDYAKTASERFTKYLQEKTIENQDAMKSELVTLRETLEVSLKANEAIIRKAFAELEEERKETRKKTPYERAQDEYQENMRLLSPTEDQDNILRENLDVKREPGTCRWIFDLKTYSQWQDSPQSALVWVSGAGGYGKSILMSTVIEKLRAEKTTNDQTFVQYFFCKAGVNATQNSRSILQSIVAQLYTCSLAFPDLLDKANAVVTQVLKKRAGATKAIENFDFALAYTGLLQIMGRDVYLVIDAVDECVDWEGQKFLQNLRRIIDTTNTKLKVKIMLCSRPDPDIAIALSRFSNIKCEGHNQDDIRRNMRSEISRFPGWTSSERDYAVESVLHKSGGQFKYVQIALDFLRKPLVRPYQKAIDKLPDGLSGSYVNSWNAIDPDYRDLLKTALTWVMFAEGSVTVPEIMDAYTRTYDDDVGVEEQEMNDLAVSNTSDFQGSQEMAATGNTTMNDGTNLHDHQILKAGGNFLDVSQSRFVNLRHLTVRDFFVAQKQPLNISSEDDTGSDYSEEQHSATGQNYRPSSPWTISAKSAHLEILKTLVQNLASFAFQKEYVLPYLSDDSTFCRQVQKLYSSDASVRSAAERVLRGHEEEAQSSWDEIETKEERTLRPSFGGRPSLDGRGDNVDDNVDKDDDGDDRNDNGDDNDDESDDDNEDRTEARRGEENEVYSNDRSELLKSLTSNQSIYEQNEGKEDAEESETNPQQKRKHRYELTHLIYHLREAQKLWTWEEQQSNTIWRCIWDLLIKFMSQTAAFEAWQDVIFQNEQLPITIFKGRLEYCAPVHIAAVFGLLSLARELIDRKFDINERRPIRWWISALDSGSIIRRSPLDLAVRMDKMDSDMVKFLVEHSSSDDLNEDGYKLVPFHQAVLRNPSYEFVEFLLLHEADISIEDASGWRALHYFAKSGTDPKVLQLLLSPKYSKEDINRATSRYSQTPLHILVDRDNPPLDLLEAFLEVGADVNVDDWESKRPLSALAQRGNWKVVEILLSHNADVHDDDDDGRTAFHEAAQAGNRETLEVLLKHRPKVNAVDHTGCTPLFLACDKNNEDTAVFLLQILNDLPIHLVNKPDEEGRTPLRQAAARGNVNILNIMLTRLNHVSKTAAVTAIHAFDSKYSQNALHKAAYHGKKAALELLLDNGGDASIADKQNLTPFQLCMQGWMKRKTRDREETLMSLIDRSLASTAHRTELILKAVTRSSAKLVEKLIDSGIDPQTKDSHGWTLLMLAQQFDQQAVVEVITKRGTSPGGLKPSRWASAKKLVKVSKSGLRVEHVSGFEVTAISDHPVPAQEKKYYFEVEVVTNQPSIGLKRHYVAAAAVGYSTQTMAFVSDRGRNAESGSYELRSNYSQGPRFLSNFETGDVVGCALDLAEKTIFFTKSGERFGPVYYGVVGRFYPAVTLASFSKCFFRANFGADLKRKPFRWEGWKAWYKGI